MAHGLWNKIGNAGEPKIDGHWEKSFPLKKLRNLWEKSVSKSFIRGDVGELVSIKP
jgi:hypothetical protein